MMKLATIGFLSIISVPVLAQTTLRVHTDLTWTITGDASRVPTQIAVYDAASGRWVRLTEDPVTWALNLNTELRTGYLTARTIHPNTSP